MLPIWIVLALGVAPLAARDLQSFLHDLIDLESLARVEFAPTRMVSTYDPTGANADGFRPEWVKGSVYTIADLKGPGVIRRFYSARPAGWLRILVDGQPLFDMPCEEFFSGKKEPLEHPLAGPMGGGSYSFFPIPFAKSIRIEIHARQESFGEYYQVTYQTFPDGVSSPRLPLTGAARREWQRVLDAWRNPGGPVAEPTLTSRIVIPAGQAGVLAALEGPAVIDRFQLKIHSPDPHWLRRTLLQIRWDDQEPDAVDTPVGDFFGNGFDERPYRSLVMGLTDSGYYSNFSMPFARRARIRLVNGSAGHPLTAECRIVYRRRQAMPPGTGYFHAKWRRQEVAGVELHERNITGEYNYSILDVTGQGRYLGTSLNVYNRHLMWWGEGDPMIFVDEDTWPPSLHGTGTEEYFNDAWGFHPGISPVSGVLLAGLSSPGRCFGPNAVFTFHLADSIPFRRRIRVTLEHGPENSLTNDYASTAYWYALPGARDFFAMRPVAERLAALPSEWEKQRQERIREFAPELRRQIRDIASTLDQFPTDARRHPRRIRLLRLVFQLADSLSLPREPVRRLEALIAEARGRPLAERFPVMDRVLRELAGLL